eukprot:1144466-Pelagomonas_calceolata.AAC.3
MSRRPHRDGPPCICPKRTHPSARPYILDTSFEDSGDQTRTNHQQLASSMPLSSCPAFGALCIYHASRFSLAATSAARLPVHCDQLAPETTHGLSLSRVWQGQSKAASNPWMSLSQLWQLNCPLVAGWQGSHPWTGAVAVDKVITLSGCI